MEGLETSMPAAQNLYSANGFLRGFNRGLPPNVHAVAMDSTTGEPTGRRPARDPVATA
jgi:hypothetical protein